MGRHAGRPLRANGRSAPHCFEVLGEEGAGDDVGLAEGMAVVGVVQDEDLTVIEAVPGGIAVVRALVVIRVELEEAV